MSVDRWVPEWDSVRGEYGPGAERIKVHMPSSHRFGDELVVIRTGERMRVYDVDHESLHVTRGIGGAPLPIADGDFVLNVTAIAEADDSDASRPHILIP